MKPQLSKETVSDDSSASESESEESTSSGTNTSSSNSKPKKKLEATSTSSGSSSDSESSESDSDAEETSKNEGKTRKRVTIADDHLAEFIPAKPFRPPQGFQPVSDSNSQSSALQDAFSDLTNKSIWHITAPATVSLSSIKKLALDAATNGQTILTQKGTDYCIREDKIGCEKMKRIIIPEKRGNKYRTHNSTIARTFQLEQVAGLPSKDAQSHIPKSRSLPTQPEGLRMRYRPFGSSTVPAAEEDNGMESTFQVPRGENLERELKKKKKRKHTDTDLPAPIKEEPLPVQEVSPRKKSKKAHAHEDKHRGRDVTSPEETTSKRGRPEGIAEQPAGKKHREETSVERRARKEEKKRRKSEKSQA